MFISLRNNRKKKLYGIRRSLSKSAINKPKPSCGHVSLDTFVILKPSNCCTQQQIIDIVNNQTSIKNLLTDNMKI